MKNTSFYIILTMILPIVGFSLKQNFDLEASAKRGKEIYNAQCTTCHMANGEGIPTIYPPLAKADFLMKEPEKSIIMILQGGNENITVNGIVYNGTMPGFSLTDQQVSDVMNYIRNTWGNTGEPIKPEQIKGFRK